VDAVITHDPSKDTPWAGLAVGAAILGVAGAIFWATVTMDARTRWRT